MTQLIVTKGLPGSGKTTWTRQQQAAKPGLWRINRDDLRAMVRPTWTYSDGDNETLCTVIQYAAIRALLIRDVDVIVDDTNLRPDVVQRFREIARAYGADFVVQDFTDVPLEVCIARDAARSNPVGEHIIRGMWANHLAPQEVQQP